MVGNIQNHLIVKYWLLVAALVPFSVAGQTLNDSSSAVRQLVVNLPVRSSTDDNTVERACVDEKLTGQCIQYHNDQWFSYVPENPSPFYINVRHEKCADNRGVQLVVFTGELCKTESYNIVSCNSPATAEDFYYKVSQPKAGDRYFMVIDGYLGDFCDFTIEVSDKANGLPIEKKQPLAHGVIEQTGGIVELRWAYQPDTADVSHFSVIRKGKTDMKHREVALAANSRGDVTSEYLMRDTLTEYGTYAYDVFLVDWNNEHHLYFHQEAVLKEAVVKREDTTVFFPFLVKKKTSLQVTITDVSTKRVLYNRFVENYKLEGLYYNFQEQIDRGHYSFEVRIYDYKTQRTEVFRKAFEFQEN